MPYILPKDRKDLLNRSPETAGELNYLITTSLLDFQSNKGLSYQTINDIVGALESAKAEYQRRVVTPYENSKLVFNGDIYNLNQKENS